MRIPSTQAADLRAGRPRRPPTPRRFYRFGRLWTQPHLFLHEMRCEFGDFMLWRAILECYYVNHPDYLRPILSQGYEHFSKRTVDYWALARVAGKGLVTNDGPHWARQRKLMQPVFGNRNVSAFDETINALTSSLMVRWNARAGGEVIRADREMGRLTLQIAGATLFGTDIERHADEVVGILDVVNLNYQEPRAIMTLLPWVPTPHNRKFNRATRRLDGVVHALISARRRAGAGAGDILDRLIEARDEETGEPLDEVQIRDEVVTLMLAGHETTANALTWTLYLLATHPEVEMRLAKDLAAHLGGAPATAADLASVPYLKQVVQESMRIYPPAWAFSRRAEREAEFGGYVLPANAWVMIAPYALHRHPEFWPDAERFDPDRFTPDRSRGRHSYCYLPFGAGPRTCIGAGMAMLEIQLILSQIVQRFRVRVVPGHRVEAVAKVTLKPRYGLPVTLTRR